MITKLARHSESGPSLGNEYEWKKIEDRVRRFYAQVQVRKQIARKVGRRRPVGYVEGPPTLNNQPHVGHARGRIIKDVYYRHSTLAGRNVVFRGGWDTQGLPVELQAEKELGLSGNKWEDLKALGEEKLVEACKNLIAKYRSSWDEADSLLGLLIDPDRAYMTYRDEYIEREWKYLEAALESGLLGEGFKVVPYCPSCQTSLSHAEVALGGYEKLQDPSLYYKVRTPSGEFLIVWTTMPFTVVTDELVAVKPDADYEFVRVGEEVWIVGSDRREGLSAEIGVVFGETTRRVKGRDLEGLGYSHPLLAIIPGLRAISSGGVHRVVSEEFVDTQTGTGIVHLSPANGEDDFAVATDRGLPVFAPFDDRVIFTEESGRFQGLFARDADGVVVDELRKAGALVHSGTLVHDYPICWRSDHRLVWLARREYFYWIDRIRKKLVAAAEKVEYFFESPRNRFLESIGDSPPWCITRERVWGTPLPVWVCQDCGEKNWFFSRKDIISSAASLPDGPDFELHRPWIDRVQVRCRKCGGKSKREAFVLDTWHNSGAAPYSAFTDGEYRTLIPAGFLTEGIDQTRAWAYTLLVLNVLKSGLPRAPYRAFLFQGHVLDDRGRKMSKSLGNTIWALDLLRKDSVDLLRYYFSWKSSPEDEMTMDLSEMRSRPYQVLNTLYHLHLYLRQNGALDDYNPAVHNLAWATKKRLLTPIDEWLVFQVEEARRASRVGHEKKTYQAISRRLEQLIISQLSQSYVRLVRPELLRDEPAERNRRLAVFSVLGHALSTADELLHPFAPFLTEYLAQVTFMGPHRWKVPLLVKGAAEVPRIRPSSRSVRSVDLALKAEEASNSARSRAGLKRRWPLRKMVVLPPPGSIPAARMGSAIIESLCNVKEVVVSEGADSFPATIELVPNRSKVGALFKKRTRDLLAEFPRLSGSAALDAYVSGRPVRVGKGKHRFEVPVGALELRVTGHAGFEIAEKEKLFVAVESRRDEELLAEGLLRDVARRVQAIRKERGYVPTRVLRSASIAGLEEEDRRLLEPLAKQLAVLVRVRRVHLVPGREKRKGWAEEDLDGKPIFLDVR